MLATHTFTSRQESVQGLLDHVASTERRLDCALEAKEQMESLLGEEQTKASCWKLLSLLLTCSCEPSSGGHLRAPSGLCNVLQVALLLEANTTLQTSLQWQQALVANASVSTLICIV